MNRNSINGSFELSYTKHVCFCNNLSLQCMTIKIVLSCIIYDKYFNLTLLDAVSDERVTGSYPSDSHHHSVTFKTFH